MDKSYLNKHIINKEKVVRCKGIDTFEKVARKIFAIFKIGIHRILDQFDK